MTKPIASILLIALLSGCATRAQNYTPLVDTKGVDKRQLAMDTSECQEFSKERMSPQGGAILGAIAGALIGVAFSPGARYNQTLATQGAFAGGMGAGTAAGLNQEQIIKSCLAGRGYKVLG